MKSRQFISMILLLALWLSAAVQHGLAQQPASTSSKTDGSVETTSKINPSTLLAQMLRGKQTGFGLKPSSRYRNGSIFNITPAPPLQAPAVLGSGTVGKISMWTGTNSSGNSILGDSIITQSGDNIGIGLATPASKLTVEGMIETTLGGYKFPDGSVQTTAGLTSIFHDSNLTGNGTASSPLGVNVPLILSGSVQDIPGGVIQAINTAEGGRGVQAIGGNSNSDFGGAGVQASGGRSVTGTGGPAVFAFGGSSTSGEGGVGVLGGGGNSDTGIGGIGVAATGGTSSSRTGGDGLVAAGGFPSGRGVVATGGSGGGGTFSSTGVVATGGDATLGSTGGAGVIARGGDGSGPNKASGHGIIASPGVPTDGAIGGAAGLFQGRVAVGGDLDVSGDLTVTHGTKNFKIDHPLDPENKYLLHASVESSEVLNIYSGNVVTDTKGEAVVILPEWFEALNRDLRYQLTVIGTFAQAIVAEKVKQNRFMIRTSAPNVEVSWQVTGVRSDRAMQKHQFRAEEDKPERERGTYIDPEAYDKPEVRGVGWTRYPELMKQLKQQRLEAENTQRQQKPTGR